MVKCRNGHETSEISVHEFDQFSLFLSLTDTASRFVLCTIYFIRGATVLLSFTPTEMTIVDQYQQNHNM